EADMLVGPTLRKSRASAAGRWLSPGRRRLQRLKCPRERGDLDEPDPVRGVLHSLRTVSGRHEELGGTDLVSGTDLVTDATDRPDGAVRLDGARAGHVRAPGGLAR